jgi:hypothetical protein
MSLPDHNAKCTPRERDDVAVTPPEFAASTESIAAGSRSSRRGLAIWGGNVFMTILVATAAMGLTRFGTHVSRQAQKAKPIEAGGAGIIIRSEMVCVWLPRALSELAERQSQSPVVRTHEELQRFLKVQHQEVLWYATTTRGQQVNGDFMDITVIRRPYDDPGHFPELLNILAAAAGSLPRYPTADFSSASISFISQQQLNREPRMVMAELLGHRALKHEQGQGLR